MGRRRRRHPGSGAAVAADARRFTFDDVAPAALSNGPAAVRRRPRDGCRSHGVWENTTGHR